MDFDILLEQFLQYLKARSRSQATIVAYHKDTEQLIGFLKRQEKLVKLEQIDTELLHKYVDELKENPGLTLKTVSRKINSLRTFFKFLVQQDKIGINPATAIKHPKSISVTPRVLTSLEYRALRDAARINPKLYTMIELLLQTGIRIGELSRLHRSDFIFNNDGRDFLMIEAYSSIEPRKIELNPLCAMAVRDFISRTAAQTDEAGFLFATKSGKPILIRNIRTSLDRIFNKAGIKDATVNDLRNTFIVYQLQNGLKIDKLAQMVGHRKVTTTERYLLFLEIKPEKTHNRITPL